MNKLLTKWLLIVSTIFMMFGVVKFMNTTESIVVTGNPITITKSTYNNNSWSINVIPTLEASPNIVYSIILDNKIIKKTFGVSWNQLELDIQKSKYITVALSTDEVASIKISGFSSKTIYELKPSYPLNWIILPTIILVICFVIYIKRNKDNSFKYYTTKSICSNCSHINYPLIPKGKQILGHIFICEECGNQNTINKITLPIPYEEQFYTVRSHCRNCGRINDIPIPKGIEKYGRTYICVKCSYENIIKQELYYE